MTQIKKFAWYGSSVAMAALMAVTLLVSGPAGTANADGAFAAATVAVGGTVNLNVDATNTPDLVIAEILGSSSGQAEFRDGTGSKQTLACADDSTVPADGCDRDADANEFTIRVRGVASGLVVVRVTEYDGGVEQSQYVLNVEVTNAGSGLTVAPVSSGINADGGTTAVNATVTDSDGDPLSGATVTFTTSLGRWTSNDLQQDTAVTNGAGVATLTLEGGAVPGTATVTVTISGASAQTTVVMAGEVASLTIKFQSSYDGGTTWVDSATPPADFDQADFRAVVAPKDSAGNRVSGVSSALTFAPTGCATVDTNTASSGTADNRITLDNGGIAVGATCTVTAEDNDVTATASFTIGAAAATTSVLTVTAPPVAVVSSSTISVSVKSATGVNVADGTVVTLVVTSGAVADTMVETKNGVASFLYVSPGTPQTVNATAVLANGVTGSANFSVGGAVVIPPVDGEGSFSGEIADSGVTLTVFSGGSVATLAATAAAEGVVTVSVTVDGQFLVYVVGAPAFVNAAFVAAFPDGLPENTPVIVKK